MSLKGFVEPMWLALKSMFRKPSTIQYPTEKPILSERYRGRHLLKLEKCTGCELCARVCPPKCIDMIKMTTGHPVNKREIYPQIDLSLCIFCSYCVDVCPPDAFEWLPNHEFAKKDRGNLIYTPTMLSKREDPEEKS